MTTSAASVSDDKVLKVAQAAHNTYAAYCRTTGDHNVNSWDDAEGWQRESTINMVKSILAGTFSVSAEHERWLAEKKEKGIVYAAVRNDDPTKGPLTNPNIVPYKELSFAQRVKGALLVVAVIGAAAHHDLTVPKVPDLMLA